MDNLTGTSGNDVFVADNSGAAATKVLSAADTINGGAGNDTLKVFLAAGDTTFPMPTLNSVETLYVNGGNLASLDVSKVTGVTTLSIDSAILQDSAAGAAAAAGTVTYTVAGQAITLANSVADNSTVAVTAGTETTTIASATDTVENITVSKYNSVKVGSGAVTATQVLDINGAKVTALNLTSTGASNAFTLTNTGTALTTLNISGDQKLTLTEGLTGLKTINASTDTGGVSIVDTATVASSFAFTGGSGNDSLSITTASLEALTAGSQLNGGAGTDTLVISNAGTLVAADYTALNATTNFEVLGVGGSATASLDASKITAAFANHFAVSDTGAVTISNMVDGSTVDVTAVLGADTFGAAVGSQTLNLNIGSSTTTGLDMHAVTETLTGFSAINLSSNGTNAAANQVVFANSDNAKFVVTGSNDLTMTVAAASATGDKIDASAFTGTFSLTDSGKGDVVLGGSGTTTITELSAGTPTAGDTITLLSGHAKVDTLVLNAAGTQTDVVNNFVLNQDVIQGNGSALKVGAELSAVKGMVASSAYATAAAFVAAAQGLGATAAHDTVAWYDAANNNTWVASFNDTTAGHVHVVELVGQHATSVSLTAAVGAVVIH